MSYILLATIIPSCIAALVITLISPKLLSKMGRALSLVATGLLLTLSLTHLLPEAMENGSDIHTIGLTIWLTIIFLIAVEMYFNSEEASHIKECPVCRKKYLQRSTNSTFAPKFTINKITQGVNTNAELMLGAAKQVAHNHPEYEPHKHSSSFLSKLSHHHHGFSLKENDIISAQTKASENENQGKHSFIYGLKNGGAPILSGSSLHALSDGVVIASAFMIDYRVGIATTTAIVAHEVPQQLSNYILMLSFGMSRLQAYIVNFVSMFGALIGASLFLMILSKAEQLLPYALAIAGGSFIYVALSDILPRINKQADKKTMVIRFIYILLGAFIAMMLSHHH